MKILYSVLLTFIFCLSVFAGGYSLYNPDDYSQKFSPQESERILFIMDFSNSMTESLDGARKVDLMLATMKEILPKISPDVSVGLRVYGHRMGLTPMEACRASTLANPVIKNNSGNIAHSLMKTKPRGMTPITYSLKQAVKYDFMGFGGKKHIILLTDGGENCDESPCKFVMELVKIRRDISIDVIAFNIKDQDDLEQLQCTALVTSGKFYNAQTAAELFNGFDNSIGGVKNVEAKIVLPNVP